MRAAGLLVDELRVDKFGRCKVDGKDRERRGWYRLHELASQASLHAPPPAGAAAAAH